MCDYTTRLRYPLDESFPLLGRKWTVPVLFEILSGKDTFNRLLRSIPGMNPKTLSARLSDLVDAGIVARRVRRGHPRGTRYELTQKGEDFRIVMRDLVGFSLKWTGDFAGAGSW
jgi:DNA-binding HxlR family transcriptional regulator